MNRGLLSLANLLKLDASQPLPARLKILNWGDNATRYGNLKVNEITLAALPENQKRLKFDHVAIDFQHNSVPGSKFYMGEPVRLAARTAVPEVVQGEGLFLNAPDWIVDAETVKSYVDLSACVKKDDDGNVIFLHSAALCRQGEVDGITFPLAADPFNSIEDTKDMNFKKLLCAILNLDPETATDSEIEAAAKKFGETEAAEDTTALAALSSQLTALSAEVTTLKTADVARERQHIITLAAHEGKVIPASALPDKDGKGGLDNAALKTLCAELPVTVPLEKRTPANGPLHTLSATAPGATGAEEQIRQSMGISKERWEKKD